MQGFLGIGNRCRPLSDRGTPCAGNATPLRSYGFPTMHLDPTALTFMDSVTMHLDWAITPCAGNATPLRNYSFPTMHLDPTALIFVDIVTMYLDRAITLWKASTSYVLLDPMHSMDQPGWLFRL